MIPRPQIPVLPDRAPWFAHLAVFVLQKFGISGLIALVALALLVHQQFYYRPDIDSSMIALLQEIASHERVQTCIQSGGLDGGCEFSALFSRSQETKPVTIDPRFFSGTIGGDGIASTP